MTAALLPPLAMLAALLCAGASFFFSGAETATISADRHRLRRLHEEGDAQAGRSLDLLSNMPRLISAVLIGNNLAQVLLVLFFRLSLDLQWPEWAHRRLLGSATLGDLVTLLFLTPATIVFAEILPKALFRARADAWIHGLRPWLRLASVLFFPVIFFLELLSRLALAPFGAAAGRAPRFTRRDVITLLNPPPSEPAEEPEGEDKPQPEAPERPVGGEPDAQALDTPSFLREPDERLLIRNIISLERTTVAEIMQPLIELEAVHLGHTTLEEFLEQARTSGYSRFPAYRHRIVRLLGYIDVYDVIRDGKSGRGLDDYLRKAYYVPETKRVDDLLQEFLAKRIKNAIVVDEYGGCCGWVSREDILEEIVGELADELDAPEAPLRELEDGSFLIEGRVAVEDLNETLGLRVDDSMCGTLGGAIMKEMGRIPKAGDGVVIEGWRMEVREMDGMRVKLAHARRVD